MSDWRPIETAPNGIIQVYLESEMQGSRIHTAKWLDNIKVIGCVFHFDAPKATHWRHLPDPPEQS